MADTIKRPSLVQVEGNGHLALEKVNKQEVDGRPLSDM